MHGFSSAKIHALPIHSPISLSPKQQLSVPKTGTLFVHYLAEIIEEIMFKNLGCPLDDFAVEVPFLEHLVDVGAVAMHLLGEPGHRATLLVENSLDNMSYMEICHPTAYKKS